MLSQPAMPQLTPAPRIRRALAAANSSASTIALILDEALDRVAGGASIEDCLDAYPEHAHDLAPLLRTGVVLRAQAATPLPPDLEAWLPAGRRDFAAIAERLAPRYARRRPAAFQKVSWQRAFVATAVVVAMMGVADTAAAASLPGQPLYAWKRAKED